MQRVLGIDLGTTYSAAAIVNEYGKPEIMVNREGERITPSVIFFDEGGPVVGDVAKRSAVANPFRVVQFVKKQMGDNTWRFALSSDEVYTPEELSALILKRLKEDVETRLDASIYDAVITVPAYFDDAQRKATQDAGRIAGLNVLRIINEPTAAALAYGIGKLSRDQTVLVYDLGGGTFDVTVISMGPKGFKVLSTGGSRNLGGCDWDNVLMNYINEEFRNKGGSDLFEDPMWEQDLREKAEVAKRILSSRDRTSLFISTGGVNASIDVTRADFDQMTKELLRGTERIMLEVLSDAGLGWPQIDNVLLAGGSTRMRSVRELISQLSGKQPAIDMNPDEVVALGAAIQGAVMVNDKRRKLWYAGSNNIVIQDVNSHSLGLVALDAEGNELNSVVLRKDTPVCSQVSRQYLTTVEGQERLHIQITEGDNSELDGVRVIGEGNVELPTYPKGTLIEVVFEYDPDGIIHLFVLDGDKNNILGELQITRSANLTEQQVEMSRERLQLIAIS